MPEALFYIAVFIFGTIVGSFLNCLIYRLEKNKGFVKGHSFCPHCQHRLAWFDLIPIISFFALRGRCRYCSRPISWQYPMVEAATGAIFLLIFTWPNAGMASGIGNFIYYLFIACCLLAIFVYDLKHFLIPDKVLFPAIIVVFLYQLLGAEPLLNPFLSALGAAGFFLAIFLASGGKWIGFGDVKLALLLGLLLGWPKIIAGLFLSFFIGAIIGTGLIMLRKKGMKSEVPFAPFLIAGTFIALFWGELLIDWYLNLVFIVP